MRSIKKAIQKVLHILASQGLRHFIAHWRVCTAPATLHERQNAGDFLQFLCVAHWDVYCPLVLAMYGV